jgi:hypothetical protein
MTQEEKQLLLEDLCGRLSHGVMVSVQGGEFDSYKYPYQLTAVSKFGLDSFCKVYHPIYTPFGVPNVEDVKPYLRPMSSMTEEEYNEYDKETDLDVKDSSETLKENLKAKSRARISKWYHGVDWLDAHHFDYRGLIEKGLALEAPEDMYKTK